MIAAIGGALGLLTFIGFMVYASWLEDHR